MNLTVDRRNPEDVINYLEDRVAALLNELRRERERSAELEHLLDDWIIRATKLEQDVKWLESMSAF